jgi:hypothetical protein
VKGVYILDELKCVANSKKLCTIQRCKYRDRRKRIEIDDCVKTSKTKFEEPNISSYTLPKTLFAALRDFSSRMWKDLELKRGQHPDTSE